MRVERLFVVTWLGACILLPLLFWEAFPFTACPMFAQPHNEMRQYRLTDAAGHELIADQYGTGTNFNWYLEEQFYAVKYRSNLVNPGSLPADIDAVTEELRHRGEADDARFPLALECTTFGNVGGSVGPINRESWRIDE